jgi:uncharacterized repeat protein (TIGR03899 family)
MTVSGNYKRHIMAEINLIKIDGKPLEKLIDVISKGVGTIYRPRAIRKDAEAKSYEIEIIERAKAKAIAEGKEIDADVYERIQERMLHQETKRQTNIDNISQIAAEQLSQEKTISEEPVDEDWSTRFFNIVEDISDDEMQNLWGRILAGEVKQPKSYSLRTLELLKNLSKEEAAVFTKFANIRLASGDKHLIYNSDNGKFLQDEFGITFSDRLLLTELGLIASENNLEFSFNPTNKTKVTTALTYGNKGIIFHRGEDTPKQALQVLVFTKTGIELSRLISQIPNTNYIEKICASFKHPNVKIEYGDLIQMPNGQLMLFNKVDYDK